MQQIQKQDGAFAWARKFLISGAALGCAAIVTAQPKANNPHMYLGPEVTMGAGTIQTYAMVNGAGKPIEVGIYFSATALQALPPQASDGAWDILDDNGEVVYPCCGHEHFLQFHPAVMERIPFKYAIVNWNPEGHVPPGIYNVPHFDFHFYTFSNEERMSMEAPLESEMCIEEGVAVPLKCDDYLLAMQPLPADQFPPGYSNVGAVEPGMGNHLLDLMSHEWHGMAFDHTWIFGAYAGRLTYWEPMITLDYLNSLKTGNGRNGPKQVNVKISTPAAAPEAGYYPSQYQIAYHPSLDGYTVSLNKMKWLPQSTGH